MSDCVLVTGAAGFIGAAIVDTLRGADHDVRAGGRHPSAAAGAVACDLDDPRQVAAAMAGVACVVHCAYGEESAMPRQCATLLRAMSAAGVRGLVHFSSIAVYGNEAEPRGAALPPDGLEGTYARAKAECEGLVRAWAGEEAGRRAVILRPGIVYGAGSRFWVDKMAARIRANIWGNFGPRADAPAPLVHVDDVARAAAAAADLTIRAGAMSRPVEALDLIGPETPSWNAYFEALAAAIGESPLPRIGPARLAWRRLLAVSAKVWRKTGLPGGGRAALAPTGGELRLFARHAVYDKARTAQLLGFSPEIGLAEGLSRSVPGQDTRPAP